MNTVVNQTKLNPYSRSVSIIGVGCTPFMNTLEDPATEGLTEGELFGYAAMEAMKDAGVTPKDVDYYFHGQANPMGCDYITPNIMVANWVGMKGNQGLSGAAKAVRGALDEAGIAYDRKKFVPHITLIRKLSGNWKQIQAPKGEMTVQKITLMNSAQKDGRRVYT